MNKKITESSIEEFTIECLERLGYKYIYAPDIAPDFDGTSPSGGAGVRQSYEEVLLIERLHDAI